MDLKEICSLLQQLKENLNEACLFLSRLEDEDYENEKEKENLEIDLKEILKELKIEF